MWCELISQYIYIGESQSFIAPCPVGTTKEGIVKGEHRRIS